MPSASRFFSPPMISVKDIYSFFQTLERWGVKVADTYAGPFCVTFACSLILTGTICFYDVIAPTLSYPIISIPICLLITLNLYMHYYYAMTIPPGFLDGPPPEPVNSFLWARKVNDDKGRQAMSPRGSTWWDRGVRITPGCPTECPKCDKFRPERAHHCRICKTCILKYDHHCPVRINQCVGVHNERHFILFMVYLILATAALVIFGLKHFVQSFIHSLGIPFLPWTHNFPESFYIWIYIISVAISCSITFLLGSSLCGIAYGETTLEAHDNQEYRQEAEKRNEEFVNSYDCGKLKNLQLFFNIGEGGYSILTLLLPLRVNPYTDGFSWARKAGYEDHPSFRKAKLRQTMMSMLHKLLLVE